TEYYSSCFYDDHYLQWPDQPLAGEFLIVAAHDSTVITIHSVTADTRMGEAMIEGMDTMYNGQEPIVDCSPLTTSHFTGETWSVQLDRGQTYLVQSTGNAYGTQDLSGTRVTGSKPFGFLS